jgi:hypothetical protein
MVQLSEMQMYEFLSGGRIATVYHFYKKGVKIIGFANGVSFKIKVLSIGYNPKRKGFGQRALKFLRPRYKRISVIEIYKGALPFWIKMKKRGLVDHLESIKEGRTLYPLKEMPITGNYMKKVASKGFRDFENFTDTGEVNGIYECEPVAYI